MKFLALIQARCGSTRLPNKVLMDMCGKTLVERVVQRVQLSKYIDETIVVTSINKINLPLVKLCANNDIRVFSGSENDVLDRFYQVAKLIEPEYIVRITADCPLYDPQILDQAIESIKFDTDYLADLNCTLADGLDIEIIKFSALKTAWENATLQSEREHVTMYVKNNRNLFNIQNFESPIHGIGNKRWTIDEQKDYDFVIKIYDYFKNKKENFFTNDILDLLSKNNDWEKINSNIIRNEGLIKSLNNDRKVK